MAREQILSHYPETSGDFVLVVCNLEDPYDNSHKDSCDSKYSRKLR